jgi:hypothetical protein
MRVPPSHGRTPEPRRPPGGPRRTPSRRAGSATPPRSALSARILAAAQLLRAWRATGARTLRIVTTRSARRRDCSVRRVAPTAVCSDAVAVSPACQPQSGPSASCARAARAPDTTAPRGDAPTEREAHIAPHHPPTRAATRPQQPPSAHAAAAHSPLRASPMRSIYVSLRSHAEPSALETAQACPTLISRSRLSRLQRQARRGPHERPTKPHTHPCAL